MDREFVGYFKDLPAEDKLYIEDASVHTHVPKTIAFKEYFATMKVHICWDGSRDSLQQKINQFIIVLVR